MTDKVTIKDAADANVDIATDDRTEGQVQEVFTTGGTTIAVSRYSATTGSAEAVAARARRSYVTILSLPTNSDTVDIGPSGVASGSGFQLLPGAAITLPTTAAIHADAASGTQVLAIVEAYDV